MSKWIIYACVLLIALQSFAQQKATLTRESFNQHLNGIEEQLSNSTLEGLQRLKPLLEAARNQGWEEEEIRIISFQISILRRFDQFSDVQELIDEYIDRAKKLDNKSVYTKFVQNLLSISDSKEDQKQSMIYRKELLDLTKNGSPTLRAVSYLTVAQSQSFFHEYKDALKNYEIALNLFETIGDSKGISTTINSIAVIYSGLNQFDKSIEYYNKALIIANEKGDDFSSSIILFNIGDAYSNSSNNLEALRYLNQALKLSEELEDEIGIAYVKRSIAAIEIENKQFDKAYKNLDEAVKLFSKHDQKLLAFFSSVSMLELMIESERYAEANDLLTQLETPAKKLTEHTYLLAYYSSYHLIKKELGDEKAALSALEKFVELQKKYFKSEKEQSIEELMVKFDTRRKENENKLLTQANQLKALRLQEQEKQNTIWILSLAFSIFAGGIIAMLLIKQIKTRNRFKRLALKDELTKAPNRRAVLEQAKEHFRNYQKMDYSLTLAMLDIDHFKQFNDTYGHDMGDEVLRIMAKACEASIRHQDHFGRYGGEEWLLVMVDAKIHDIESVFERLSNYLRKSEVAGIPSDVRITFSLGASEADISDKDLEAVIKRADNNLYKAKQQGRDQFVI